MGLPERLVDRQLERATGTRLGRLRDVRTGQRVLLACVALGLLTAAILPSAGGDSPLHRLWSVLGVLWLVVGYVNWRQRRYLRRLLSEAEG